MSTGLIILIVIVIGLFSIIGSYNSLVTLRNRYKNAFSQIDVQLKRRYDLIPNLVETAKAYMAHEKDTLEAVINARNRANQAVQQASINPGDAAAITALSGAENQLSGALGRMFALAESYPDLKANQNMGQLMEELSSTENKVSFARQAFNDAVMSYNTARESFPTNIIANMFAFQGAQSFEITKEEEKEAPKVSFK